MVNRDTDPMRIPRHNVFDQGQQHVACPYNLRSRRLLSRDKTDEPQTRNAMLSGTATTTESNIRTNEFIYA